MPDTARDFITLALKEANVSGVGQTPLDEYVNTGLTLLNRMMAQWAKRRWLVPMLKDIKAVGNYNKSNPIGPGQYWNTERPDKIFSGYFIQLNTGNGTPVSYPLRQIFSYENYLNVALKDLQGFPSSFFYDGSFPYGNVFINPLPGPGYELHLLIKGAIGFKTGLSSGTILTAGGGYTNGVYNNVPLVDGAGHEATANITVAGTVITTIEIVNPGYGYVINDTLTVETNAPFSLIGSGFTYQVTNLTSSLDTQFNMPEEYEEAIHSNLVIRLAAFYNKPVNPITAGIAKVALNTLKNANAQVPTLGMPAGLIKNFGGGSGIIGNSDASLIGGNDQLFASS